MGLKMAKPSLMTASPKKALSKELMKRVKSAVRFSYAPYSKILVSAGLYCASGKIYTGVNIENSSYSLTMCAERIALFKACGACLQVLSEFAPDIIIVLMNENDELKFYPIKTLLAKPFTLVSSKS
jgi:cytidine deaminase